MISLFSQLVTTTLSGRWPSHSLLVQVFCPPTSYANSSSVSGKPSRAFAPEQFNIPIPKSIASAFPQTRGSSPLLVTTASSSTISSLQTPTRS